MDFTPPLRDRTFSPCTSKPSWCRDPKMFFHLGDLAAFGRRVRFMWDGRSRTGKIRDISCAIEETGLGFVRNVA